MSKYIDTEALHKVVLKRKVEYGNLADLIDNIVEGMVKETPYADVVEKEKYEMLNEWTATLRHQLEETFNRIDELNKLNGNMRKKIDKAIKEIKEESYLSYDGNPRRILDEECVLEILERNIGE